MIVVTIESIHKFENPFFYGIDKRNIQNDNMIGKDEWLDLKVIMWKDCLIRMKVISMTSLWMICNMLGSLGADGQNARLVDSLLSVSTEKYPDTSRVYNYIDIAWEYNAIDPVKTDSFARMAYTLATKARFKSGVAKSLYVLGENYYMQSKYTEALSILYRSADLCEELRDAPTTGIVFTTIGCILTDTRNFDKALIYLRKALLIKEKAGAKKSIAVSYMDMGNVFREKEDYDSALVYYGKAKKIMLELHYEAHLAQLYNNFGVIYKIQGHYSAALNCYLKSLELKEKSGNVKGLAVTSYNIGFLQNVLKHPDEALKYFTISMQYARQANSIEDMKNVYQGLSDMYAQNGNFKEAYRNFQDFYKLQDSIFDMKNLEKLDEMQTRYETKKKEKEIEILTKERQIQKFETRQTITIISSVSTFFILVIIIVMVSVNLRRQKKHRREIVEQIVETEEKERAHFAEDLHDGLGPLLSSISLYVNELSNDQLDKGKKEKLACFSSELIDEAISSVKIIANNLTPLTLRDYGLMPAIDSFTLKVNTTGQLNIFTDDKTRQKRYHSIIEVSLYRIALEMINNTLKYADARNVTVTLREKNNMLCLEYHDDGAGFDFVQKQHDIDKGLGLNNIQNRTKSINGKCEIKSLPGAGFHAFIEIPLKYLHPHPEG